MNEENEVDKPIGMSLDDLNAYRTIERNYYTQWLKLRKTTGSSSKELRDVHKKFIDARCERLRYIYHCSHIDKSGKSTFIFNKMFGTHVCSFCNKEAWYSGKYKAFILHKKADTLL